MSDHDHEHGAPIRHDCDDWCRAKHELYVKAIRAKLERVRLQLAACGVVADSNTKESAERNRVMNPEYHSASLDSVIRAVDSEMSLRAELEAARAKLAEYEARKCENCSHLDKCNHSIIYRPMRAQIILSSCSAFEPKGE